MHTWYPLQFAERAPAFLLTAALYALYFLVGNLHPRCFFALGVLDGHLHLLLLLPLSWAEGTALSAALFALCFRIVSFWAGGKTAPTAICNGCIPTDDIGITASCACGPLLVALCANAQLV